MNKNFAWLPAVFLGALIGAAAGIGMEGLVDPAGEASDASFSDSERLGFALRYVGLGAIAGAAIWRLVDLSQRRRSLSRPSALLAFGALALVAVAGALPVILDEGGDDPVPANVRATFLANCGKLTSEGADISAAKARTYCGCLVDSMGRGRSRGEVDRLLVLSNRSITTGVAAPEPATKAAEECVKKVGIQQ